MAKFWVLIEVIKGLISLVKEILHFKRTEDAKRDAEKKKELEDAVDKSKDANTDDEVWDSQKEIIENKP